MVLVSVVIPCFKQAHFLPDAIESVLTQTCASHEVIVVDDGSPDNVAAVVSRYPGVRYIPQVNRGLAGARNAGLRHAQGRYVLFLDADDKLLPNHLALSLEAFARHPFVALVCGNYRWFGAADTWHMHNCTPRPDYYGSLLRYSFNIPVHTALIRRDAAMALGGFDESLSACEDLDFFLRLTLRFSMHCHHQEVAEYRRHPAQMTRSAELIFRGYRRIIRRHRKYIKADARYRAAYREGYRRMRRNWGEPLLWELSHAMRRLWLRRVFRNLRIVLRYYPSGLLHHAYRKVFGAAESVPSLPLA